ncbi:MAG TPA: winged helix-turn-helix domain-containing protein [Terriglobia bacterium]|nr:winged helix-turn-helix domain-containing protein [Terriglobia bacterium]
MATPASNAPQVLLFGPFRLDVNQRLLFRGAEEVPLTPKVFDTLLVLVEHHGRVLDKDYLMRTLWPNSFVEEGSLARNISLLRKTLGESPDDQKYIQTIPRRGYRFLAPVEAAWTEELGSGSSEGDAVFHPSGRVLQERAPDVAALSPASDPEVRVFPQAAAPVVPWRLFRYAALAGLAGLALGGFWGARFVGKRPAQVMHAAIVLPADEQLGATLDVPIVLSPDGRHLIYAARKGSELPRLYVRSLDRLESRPLVGTERANHPFISPDGEWVGFFSGGSLKKIPFGGGAVMTITPTGGDLRGAAWTEDNTIIFGTNSSAGLFEVSADGGVPEPLTTVAYDEGETNHRWPEVLPGRQGVLFVVSTSREFDNARIAFQRFGDARHTVLLHGGTFPQYLPTGHLVFSRAGSLLAVPFDPKRPEIQSLPVPVLEGMLRPTSPIGAADFTISSTGTLAYVPRQLQRTASSLVWVNREGVASELTVAGRRNIGDFSTPRLSPDGQLVAVQSNGENRDIWIYSLSRETMVRLTTDGINSLPLWTPDGSRVVYQSTKAAGSNLYWQPVHGRGPEERLTPGSPGTQYPGSFTSDGRLFLYSEIHPQTKRDLLLLPLDGERKPAIFLQTPYDETTPRVSPDGRYVAYVSDESGHNEVYVQPLRGSAAKLRISANGGSEVVWGHHGEIFYRADNSMMAVPVRTYPTLEIGRPRRLFEDIYLAGSGRSANYDVTPDGNRFLMLKPVELPTSASAPIHVVLHWSEDLKARFLAQ